MYMMFKMVSIVKISLFVVNEGFEGFLQLNLSLCLHESSLFLTELKPNRNSNRKCLPFSLSVKTIE